MDRQPQVTLYLIRHGETEVNAHNCVQGMHIDPPLNELGRRQAQCVGQRFRDVAVDWIVTSEARRAKETAAAISQHHEHTPTAHFGALNELCFGDLEGYHVSGGYTDLVRQWDVERQTSVKAPGPLGESPEDCWHRAQPCLQQVVDEAVRSGRRQVCVVVHSRLIQIVLAAQLGGSLGDMMRYRQRKAAVNVVDVVDGRWQARAIDDVTHMPADTVSRVSSSSCLPSHAGDEKIRFEMAADGTVVLRQV
ncbi:hypothetical protein GGI07_001065 [Coemansia sp. Benny D115]|nr:hypothetical protein GGI07_001065 [Coemansia sp. Benny D115]